MLKKFAAGIDIGGTNSVVGLVDEHGLIAGRDTVSTRDFDTAEQLVEAISRKAEGLLKKQGNATLIGAGIGAPSGNYYTGCIDHAPNLKWGGIIPLGTYFQKHLHPESVITNDANAGALGELLFGAARGLKDFLFVTLGTGLGSGIVVNGELVYGHDGMAGEMGHVILIPGGRLCGCGRRGCLETYCSATGIRTTFLEKSGEADRPEVNAKYIFELAETGHGAAMDSFQYTGELLGLALANSVAYTSPSDIFLFGGLAQAGIWILEPTRKSLEANLLHVYRNKVKLGLSMLVENDSAILGAASLIWKKVRSHKN
ncbi:MAG TPA: ROK family protein [Bacteroidia bacterium]|jgi:glucokinase|nr:ROK family protein [Bacteroidia bacterium]